MPESLFSWSCRPKACRFIKKEILAQVFSCEFKKNFQNTFFTEHLLTTAFQDWQQFHRQIHITNSISEWLIFCCANLIPHERYTNANLKISPNVRVPMKIIPWNWAFLIVGILELFTRKVCSIFVYEHI